MAAVATPLAPAHGGTAPRPTQRWTWRLQALLSAYLPLLLMAMLASGTWWLVKNTPTADGPTEARPLRHEPDYRMQGFELQRMGADGRLRVRIEGSEMRHYPDTDTLEIDGIRLRAHGLDGSVTIATARSALANADASDIQLLGDVQVQRFDADAKGVAQTKPSLAVRGEFLQALTATEVLRSHLPVQISYAGGTLQAQRFNYDHLKGQMDFGGRTTARFEPPGTARKDVKK